MGWMPGGAPQAAPLDSAPPCQGGSQQQSDGPGPATQPCPGAPTWAAQANTTFRQDLRYDTLAVSCATVDTLESSQWGSWAVPPSTTCHPIRSHQTLPESHNGSPVCEHKARTPSCVCVCVCVCVHSSHHITHLHLQLRAIRAPQGCAFHMSLSSGWVRGRRDFARSPGIQLSPSKMSYIKPGSGGFLFFSISLK